MRVTFAICCAAFVVSAQDPAELFSKAPPVIDDALRARIAQFYQAHKEGKFRAANEFVAEDSKDIYFETDKRRCRNFKIARITYENDFTSAKVIVSCDTEVVMARTGRLDVTIPLGSRWKIEEGAWCWYAVPTREVETAFGKMVAGGGDRRTELPKGPTAEDLQRMASVDRDEVRMTIGQTGVEEVTVTSVLPGAVKLNLAPVAATDIAASFDRVEIEGNGSARLTVRYTPDPAKPRRASTEDLTFTVMPLNKIIRVRVTFDK